MRSDARGTSSSTRPRVVRRYEFGHCVRDVEIRCDLCEDHFNEDYIRRVFEGKIGGKIQNCVAFLCDNCLRKLKLAW